MEEKYLYQLAEFVLPVDLLNYFSIVKIEHASLLLRIYLDEKIEEELSDDIHFESKGFMDSVEITDFPIRDHKVILVLRRRRWIDTRTGKSFSLPLNIDITASGTRYSKEFGAFLKVTYGDIPCDLPYA
ncbi:ISAon1 family transposase N-terminal region protein [Prevotella koreensis]